MSNAQTPSQSFNILKAASIDNRVLVSGPLIQIDAINSNDWGIGASEVDNYIKGVVGVPLRKCSGIDETASEHSCDYNWNPKDDIGRVIGAKVLDGWIYVTAEVTDSIAQRKIDEGTWDTQWSAFLAYTKQHASKMVSGTKPLSVTLVKDPAYGSNAKFTVDRNLLKEANRMTNEKYSKEDVDKLVAAAVSESTKNLLSPAAADKLVSAAIVKEREKITGMVPKTEVDKLIAAAVEQATSKEGGEGTITKGEVAALVSAAVAKAAEGTIPRADVENLIAASVEQAKNQTIERLKIEALATEVADLQVSAGIIKADEKSKVVEGHMLKSAATLEADKDMFGKVITALASAGIAAVDKFRGAHIQTGGANKSGYTVGNFNDGKSWGDV